MFKNRKCHKGMKCEAVPGRFSPLRQKLSLSHSLRFAAHVTQLSLLMLTASHGSNISSSTILMEEVFTDHFLTNWTTTNSYITMFRFLI